MTKKIEVLQILTDVLGVDVNEQTTMENCAEWDSFNHLQIIMELKDKFSFDISVDLIENLITVKSIIEFIEQD